ncbi:hypothetical protein I656_00989 [Geobacillus sp. WSUCF1]|nr:hypothetical protein I656_00989 [Geobacillus sp. WSUCF1]
MTLSSFGDERVEMLPFCRQVDMLINVDAFCADGFNHRHGDKDDDQLRRMEPCR